MSQIFISALREAAAEVQQFEEALERLAPRPVRVFRPASLPLGPGYLLSLEAELARSSVMLVFAGPEWLQAIANVKAHPVGRLLLWEIQQAHRTLTDLVGVPLCDRAALTPEVPVRVLRRLALRRVDWRGAPSAEAVGAAVLESLNRHETLKQQEEEARRREDARQRFVSMYQGTAARFG